MANEVRLALASFLDSHRSENLGSRENTRDLAKAFFEASFEDVAKAPEFLEGHDLERILLEFLPPRLRKGNNCARDAGQTVEALLSHIEESWVVPHIFELRRALEENGARFEEIISAGESAGTRTRKQATVQNRVQKLGRNDPCWCGSGKKFKKCCGSKST